MCKLNWKKEFIDKASFDFNDAREESFKEKFSKNPIRK